MKPDLITVVQKKAFFYRDVTAFHQVPLTSLVFRHAKSRKASMIKAPFWNLTKNLQK